MLYDPKQEERIRLREQAQTIIDLLNRYGWCQKTLEDQTGALCLVGALIVADFDRPTIHCTLHERVCELGFNDIPDWNDQPERTKGQVLAFLAELELPCNSYTGIWSDTCDE